MSMTTTREGGCLCGAVRFRAIGEPLRTLVCHCRFCQRMTGSAFFAQASYDIGAVEFTGAPMSQHAHRSEGSGRQVYVHFCPRCGTTVSLTFERWPQARGMSRGAFDEPDSLSITSHIWTSSAQTGVALPAATDCFAFARASLDGVPAVPEVYEAPRLARGAQP
jgi:hypothetical protein